jgi:hypothetical protein
MARYLFHYAQLRVKLRRNNFPGKLLINGKKVNNTNLYTPRLTSQVRISEDFSRRESLEKIIGFSAKNLRRSLKKGIS